MDKISFDEIPNLPEDSLLSGLSINMKEIMKKRFFNDICVPKGTSINLGFESGAFPIIIKNKNFEFKINNDVFSYGTHLESRHSQFYYLIKRDNEFEENELFYFKMGCVYEASFLYPKEYDDLYNYYVEYGKNIKTILMEEWDFNHFLENLPTPILFSIDEKLNRLLKDKNK
jgi:hypothetical protein